MKTRIPALAASILIIAACSSGGDTASESAAPTDAQRAAEGSRTPTSTPEAPDGCLEVAGSKLEGIATGGETAITPVAGAAVKSPDFAKVYFIAMEFSAEGIPDQVGVWASNSLDAGSGIIMAVDGFAQEFSDWPDADATDAQISKADPSVAAAKECLP